MIDKQSVAGTVLGALRAARGINQSIIAEECGRSISYISSWENNQIDIPEILISVYAKHTQILENHIWDLIKNWDQHYSLYKEQTGNRLEFPTYRERLSMQLRQQYYQPPLNPRTRRTLERKI